MQDALVRFSEGGPDPAREHDDEGGELGDREVGRDRLDFFAGEELEDRARDDVVVELVAVVLGRDLEEVRYDLGRLDEQGEAGGDLDALQRRDEEEIEVANVLEDGVEE